MKLKYFISFSFIALSLITDSYIASAQDDTEVVYPIDSAGGTQTSISAGPGGGSNFVGTRLDYGEIRLGAGLSKVDVEGAFVADGWNGETTDYIEFFVEALPGFVININTANDPALCSSGISSGQSGPASVGLYVSNDGFLTETLLDSFDLENTDSDFFEIDSADLIFLDGSERLDFRLRQIGSSTRSSSNGDLNETGAFGIVSSDIILFLDVIPAAPTIISGTSIAVDSTDSSLVDISFPTTNGLTYTLYRNTVTPATGDSNWATIGGVSTITGDGNTLTFEDVSITGNSTAFFYVTEQ
ncbi:MAG: hypothetical protein AAFY98_07065 [Verrucomicrobiota bacterium]